MLFRKIFGYGVLIITILSVNLLTNYIANFMMHYKGITHPLKFTAIGMSILVVILFPAFRYLDQVVKSTAKRFLSKGHPMFGKIAGTILMFVIALFILYCIYAKTWFGLNVPKIIITKLI